MVSVLCLSQKPSKRQSSASPKMTVYTEIMASNKEHFRFSDWSTKFEHNEANNILVCYDTSQLPRWSASTRMHAAWETNRKSWKMSVLLESYNPFALTETWWDESHDWSVAVDSYRLFRSNRRGQRGGGIALYIKKSI